MPRYLTLIHLDEQNPPFAHNTPETDRAIGALFKEVTEAGVMLETASPTPSAGGKSVTWSGGKVSVTDGPFTEAKEVIGGYAIMQCRDEAEALEWTRRFLGAHDPRAQLTIEVREIAPPMEM